MSARPRVHASAEWESSPVKSQLGIVGYPPGVSIHVDFDLHDHERALTYLERAVANVRAQIEETA